VYGAVIGLLLSMLLPEKKQANIQKDESEH